MKRDFEICEKKEETRTFDRRASKYVWTLMAADVAIFLLTSRVWNKTQEQLTFKWCIEHISRYYGNYI